MITTLILPDGSTISSGIAGKTAILAFSHTACVNTARELEPGACCAAMIRVDILGQAAIESGMELEVWRGEKRFGYFTVKTTQRNGGLLTVTAYDRVTLLDRELTAWLAGRRQWPVTLQQLAAEVCLQCGVELETAPTGDYTVDAFSASYVTGRQLMQWICQAAGCFCRANAEGRLECAWYEQTNKAISASGTDYYYQGTLQLADYQTDPVQQVRLVQTGSDVGVVWPGVTEQVNTYVLRGNPLLTAHTTDQLEPVARQLYTLLEQVTYTPCNVYVPEHTGVRAGDILTVAGKQVYAMTVCLEQGRLRVECTGSRNRSDSANVTVSHRELAGRVLEIDTRIDGLTAENRDSAGRLSRLSMTVDALSAQVSTKLSAEQQRLTKLEQTAEALSLQVQQAAGQVVTATGYTFDASGLRIARSGAEMENCLDHSGMYVRRAGETILQANGQGVVATDVQVRNYLHVGSHARFEDYAGRTACFYIEGAKT